MADAITITEADRVEAENILEQFLVDRFAENSDFSKGSALRDLCINAMAYTFAYLKKERDYIRARQSLLLLGTLTGTDVDDAVDEILSNWFISRKTGRKATGTITIYFSRAVDVAIPTTTMFYQSSTIAFLPNSSTTLTYGTDDLMPIRNSNGEISSYSLDIPAIAADVGEDYDIDPGSFVDYTRFSSYVLRAENRSPFSGGAGVESTEDLLDRSPTAISVRDLNSPRSIDSMLRDNFSNIDGMTVIGYGDPEMARDLIAEGATGTRIHAGGCVDVFLRMPITENKTFTGLVGGEFTDIRPALTSFRDDTVTDFTDLPGGSIEVGDIIEIYNYLPLSEPNRYVVKIVQPHGLEVSARSAFPAARPTIGGAFDDGSVEGGNAEFASAGHSFVTIETGFVDDGRVVIYETTFKSDAYQFIDGDVGKWLQVTGSGSGNDGIWKIVSVTGAPAYAAELRDSTGVPPTWTTENFLDWNLLSSTDHEKFIAVYDATNPGNIGTWRIQAILNEYTVRLIDAAGSHPVFTAESPLNWKLLTQVVEYSVGNNSPGFNNKISRCFTGEFTNIVQYDGCVMLPGEPIYLVKDVSFYDALSKYKSTDGRVHFLHRVNKEPAYYTLAELSQLEYRVRCSNPEEAQSGWQRMLIDIGWPDGGELYETKNYFNGQSLRVTYDTLTGYDAVWSYMLSGDQRILCGSVIPRGLHPIYVSISIRYSLSKNATEGIDHDLAKQALADYITNSSSVDPLDMSDIMSFLRSTYSVLGYIEPFDIYYNLLAPDGRVIYYKTSDVIVLDPTYSIDPDTGFIPNPGERSELVLQDPLGLGVSTNTVCYLSLPDLLSFTQL